MSVSRVCICTCFFFLMYRLDFVEAYISYLFNHSVDGAFQAFAEGFLKVCGGEVLVSKMCAVKCNVCVCVFPWNTCHTS